MNDASLFQLGIGPETGAQEEDTDRGSIAANDDTILPRDALDEGRDDHVIRRDGAEFAGTHLIIDVVNGHRLDNEPRTQKAFRDCVDTFGATLLGIHTHKFSPQGVSGVAFNWGAPMARRAARRPMCCKAAWAPRGSQRTTTPPRCTRPPLPCPAMSRG